MAGSIILVASVGVFLLAVLDVLLSDHQKARIAHWTTRAWDFLDGLKRRMRRNRRIRHGRFWAKHRIVTALFAFVAGVCLLGLVLVVFHMIDPPTLEDEVFDWKRHMPTLLLVVVAWLGVIIFTHAIFDLILWCSLAVVYFVAASLLLSSEFVTRRVAEHPKGPIIALSALVAASVTLLKAFGGI